MADEPVTLRLRDGRSAAGTAAVTRSTPGRRAALAAGAAAGGLVLALLFLPIPGLHFFSTWACPLFGFALARFAWAAQGSYASARGACPGCAADVELAGGPIEPDTWRACPSCRAPVEVVLG